MALCLGVNLTIGAVVDSVLLRPLPFPAPGRAFTDEETTYQTDSVAILTDALWRQPRDFSFLSSTARMYMPLSSDPDARASRGRHSGRSSQMIARLQPGTAIEEAQLWTIALTAVILSAVSVVACVLPSHRASRICPMEALAEE